MAFNIKYITGTPAASDHWNKRTFGYFFDLIVVLVLYLVVSLILLAIFQGGGEGYNLTGILFMFTGDLSMTAPATVLTLIIAAIYFGYMDSSMSGTIGKRFLGLETRSLEGPMTFQKAVTRNGTKLAGILIGGLMNLGMVAVVMTILIILDLFMVLGNSPDPRQKYTDTIAGSTVVRTDVEENIEELKYIPPPDEEVDGEPSGVSVTTDVEDDIFAGLSDDEIKTVEGYKETFGLNDIRAINLYKAGYKKPEDLKDAIPEDLVLVEKINPTVARAIVSKMNEEKNN